MQQIFKAMYEGYGDGASALWRTKGEREFWLICDLIKLKASFHFVGAGEFPAKSV